MNLLNIQSPKSSRRHSNIRGIATVPFVAIVVVLIIITGVGYGLYATAGGISTTTTTATSTLSTTTTTTVTGSVNATSASANVTLNALAYLHWSSIANGNLNATLSEYSQNATLVWSVSPSSANNGTYSGINNISSVWELSLQQIQFLTLTSRITVSGSQTRATQRSAPCFGMSWATAVL